MPKLNVLVPLDGSDFSRSILPTLKQVLKPHQYALTLLRVTALPAAAAPYLDAPDLNRWEALASWSYVLKDMSRGTDDRDPRYIDEALSQLKDELVSDLGSAKRELEVAGFDVSVVVEFGDPATEISHYASEGFELIALATHGRSGLSRVVMGSVAESVLRKVDIPILMVHPSKKRAGETLPLTKTRAVRGGA